MIKIELQKSAFLEQIIPPKNQATKEQFILAILAKELSKSEKITSLLAQPLYEKNIQILPHQVQTALHVLNNFSHRALLADEVGLGKTIETAIIIKEYLTRGMAKSVLILTPATLKYQWQEELRSKFDEHFIVASNPDDITTYDKIIISIDTAKTERYKAIIETRDWDLLVIDEAHKLKNSQTQNYQLVKSIHKDRCLMLTATPLQNNIFELWALLDLLHPGLMGTKAKFTSEFLADKEGLKINNKEILQEKLSKVMIRNMRKNTGLNFAKRDVKTHLLDYTKEESDFYQDAISFIKTEYNQVKKKEQGQEVEDIENVSEEDLKNMAIVYRQKGLLTFALIMLTRQLTSSISTGIEAIKRYQQTLEDKKKITLCDALLYQAKKISKDSKKEYLLKLIKKEKDKIIIFTTFLHTQKMLEMELKLQGFSTIVFNGSMTPEEKEKAILDFKTSKQILICTDAGSEGRNLQFAHILINYDLPWNPMRIEQRIGRVHRIGQEHDVIIHNLAIKDTIEGYILNRLYEKINLFQVSIGEMDLILSHLKGKQSIEYAIFENALEQKDEIEQDLTQAKQEAEQTKQLDFELFDSMQLNAPKK